MELRIPLYGTHIGRFTALPGEICRLETIAFGSYRPQAESSGGKFYGKVGVPCQELSCFQLLMGAGDN
jgi:hypothetical protein